MNFFFFCKKKTNNQKFYLDGQALFRAFLRTEFSEENLEFWLACDEFRVCKEPKRSAKAKKIYMDFIAIGSPKQVKHEIFNNKKKNLNNYFAKF